MNAKNKQNDNASSNNSEKRIGSWLKQAFGFQSFIVMIVGLTIMIAAIKYNEGYNWAWETLLKKNWKFIQANRSASIEERYTAKLGFTYVFLNHIKKNTPQDVILLFPSRKQLLEESQYDIDRNITGKNWVLHFLYPRQIVYADDENNPLREQANYVVIVNGHGYELLDYEPNEHPSFGLVPTKNK